MKRPAQQPDRHDDERDGEEDDAERVELLRALEETLRGGFLALRFFDELDQLGEGRFGGEFRHAHLEAAVLVERPGEEGVATRLFDRQRFAGDGGLVHAAHPLDHHAIDGNAFPGPHQHDVADDQLLDRDQLRLRAALAEGRLGPQLHQRGDGGAAPLHRQLLQRVRERKEEEEHRALEGVMHIGRAERREDHEQIDIDRAVKQRADAMNRAMPAPGEIGEEEKPRRSLRGKPERRAESAEQHEEERCDHAPDYRVGPVDLAKPGDGWSVLRRLRNPARQNRQRSR